MPLQGTFAYPLGVPPTGLTADQVTDLIIQVLPVGAIRMYGLARKAGDVFNVFAALGDAYKAFLYDGIAILRAEINPATTAYKLGEWEAALGLSQTQAAISGNVPARRAQIISRLREQGAFTVANIQAILGPLLGYSNPSQLSVLEMPRASLTQQHTYQFFSAQSLAANTAYSQTVWIGDDGGVSDAGAQVNLIVVLGQPQQLSFSLSNTYGLGSRWPTQPNGTAWPAGTLNQTNRTKTWAANAAFAGNTQFTLYDLGFFVGDFVTGPWTFSVTTGAATCIFSASVFVEGGGVRDAAGNSGLGMQMHDWIVQFDSTIGVAPNFTAAKAALARIAPADSNPVLVNGTTAKCGPTLYGPFTCNTL